MLKVMKIDSIEYKSCRGIKVMIHVDDDDDNDDFSVSCDPIGYYITQT